MLRSGIVLNGITLSVARRPMRLLEQILRFLFALHFAESSPALA